MKHIFQISLLVQLLNVFLLIILPVLVNTILDCHLLSHNGNRGRRRRRRRCFSYNLQD